MESEVRRLLDEAEIARQLHAYCRSMDRCDRALGHAVFHDGATADYGAIFHGQARDFVDHACAAHMRLENHQHRLSNIVIAIDGDHAGSESYVDARFRQADGDRLAERATRGRYLDRWERRDGRWAIVHRGYIHEMDEVRPVDPPRLPAAGRRDRDDPSYALIG